MSIDPRNSGGRRSGPNRKLSHEQEAELTGDYLAGMPVKAMRTKYGLSHRGVYNILARHASSVRPSAEGRGPKKEGNENSRTE